MKTIDVQFIRDDDAGVWVAVSDEVPIALENESLDVLMGKVKDIVPEIRSLNGDNESITLHFHADRLLEAV